VSDVVEAPSKARKTPGKSGARSAALKAKGKPSVKAKASKTLRQIPFKVTDPERLLAKRYYDQEFYDLECKYLWPYVWQMAARLEEIPEIGDWVEYKNLDKSVIVVRTNNGVKAFGNACRHRGVQLASGAGNCKTQGFICPFHGWRYDLEGKCTFVFHKQIFGPEALEAAELNLVPIRCELWGGCAFINLDDDAAPLLECIKPFAEWHDPRNVEKLKMEWWLSAELPVNWKLAMEAFQEGYHVMRTHPQLHAVSIPGTGSYGDDTGGRSRQFMTPKEWVEAFIVNMKCLGEGMAGMIRAHDWDIAEDLKEVIELPDDLEAAKPVWVRALNKEITERRRAQGVPMPDLNAIPPVSPDNFCFPHYFLLPTFGNMSSYRIRPLGPEKCLFELYSLVLYPEDEVRPVLRAPVPTPTNDPIWPAIPAQDYSNLPLEQLGLHAPGFEYMRLAKHKEGSISNYHRVIDGFLEGRSKEELVIGCQNACAPIDSPIMDDVWVPHPERTGEHLK
jgi:phenylpropionate dioxygenase-like ring-hydroxylating dioxygenase large terminal subunit